jgi:choice-of-anchor B domain-containing protein
MRCLPPESLLKIVHSKLGPLLLAGLLGALAWGPATVSAQVTLRNLTVQSHLNEYPALGTGSFTTDYSACWSYVHADGREYAVIGVGDGYGGGANEGTAIYNVTNPASPYRVAFIQGPPSIWREMKQYRSWIYIVTEGTGPGEGVQIVRMTDPEHPVLAATYTGNFHRSHTVAVDTTRALLICNGTRWNAGDFSSYYFSGMRILSLAKPEAPVEIGHWPAVMPTTSQQSDSLYVHDSVPVGNRLYASSIVYGIQRVFDLSDPSNPLELSEWTYAGSFSHNSWPDATGNWLYVTDERNGEPLKIFNISNLASPVLFNGWTPNPAAIVHNVHVKGTDLYVANYTEGIRILDASDPAHPAEFAYADTWAGPSGDYNGVWETCPFFPSGTIIASDRTSGLWVFRAQRNYGLARIRAVDATTSQPLGSVKVFLDASDSTTTTSDGFAVFAPGPGSHEFTTRRFGYDPGSATTTIVQGGTAQITLSLNPRPTVSFSGAIRSTANQAPLKDAELDLDYTPLRTLSDAAGHFSVGAVPIDAYHVTVRCPGYIPVTFDRQLGPGNAAMDFQLVPAPFYDSFQIASGWTTSATDDNASPEGRWTLVDPVGTYVKNGGIGWGSMNSPSGENRGSATGQQVSPSYAVLQANETRASTTCGGNARGFSAMCSGAMACSGGGAMAAGASGTGTCPCGCNSQMLSLTQGPVQPADDRSPNGTKCFVTGQGTDTSSVDEADVDNGKTTLVSPPLDLTGKSIPTIGYWRWFYTSTPGSLDYFSTWLSNDNGVTWTQVDVLRDPIARWEEHAIRVSDYLTPTTQVRVRFVAADDGGPSIVEAGVDDISVYDGAAVPVGASPTPAAIPASLAWRNPWPNPAAGTVRAVLELPRAGHVQAEVMDLQGRVVARIFDRNSEAGARVFEWKGQDAAGHPADPGIYFLVARAGGVATTTRFILLH